MTTSKGWLTLIVVIAINIQKANAGVIPSKIAGIRSVSNGKGTTLSINPSSRTIVLRKQNGYLILDLSSGRSIYNFVSGTNTSINKLIYKKNPQGYKLGFYQFQNDFDYSACTPEDSISKLSDSMQKITASIKDDPSKESSTEEASILDKSCEDKLGKSKFALKKVAMNIAAEDSYLGRCLSNPIAKEKLSKIKNFGENIDLIVNELANDRAQFQQGKLPLKIACEDSPAQAKFNAKYKNGVITLPVNNNTPVKTDCLTQEAILSHELLHKAGIKSEKHVAIFDAICSSIDNPDTVDDKKCASQFSMKSCVKSPEKCGMAAQMATKEALLKHEKTIQKKAAKVVKDEVAKSSIKDVAVSEEDWNSLSSDQDTIQSNTATRNIASTMSENYDSFSGAVNRTAAIMQSPAYAASSSDSNDSYSSTSSSTSRSRYVSRSSSDDDAMYTTEEYLADKYPEVSVSKKSATLSTNSQPTVTRGIASTNNPSSTDTAGLEASTSDKSENIKSSRNVTKRNTSETASGATTSASGNSLGGTSANGNGAGTSISANGSARRGIAQASTSPAIATLQTNEVVTGSAYQKITSSYDNPTFSRELSEQGVSITISSEGVTLGKKINQATLKFIDDGKSLKRVKGR